MRTLLLATCSCAALLGTGCGRLGFGQDVDPDSGPLDDSGGTDGTSGDLGPLVMETFGEGTGTTYANVTSDTYVTFADGPLLNFGGADNLRLESDKSEQTLIAFKVTALPTDAIVAVAELTVWAEIGAAGATITVREVQESWTEGSLDGAAGAANHDERNPGVAWSTAGALPPGSAGANVVATFEPAAVGAYTFTFAPAIVQAWIANPTTNFGFVMSSSSAASVRLVSSEGSVTQRPILTVHYARP